MESVRHNDYTAYQLRSFAFCKAETTANQRLHRLDEFKAVVDQISSKEGFKNYKSLRKEIVASHAVERKPEDVVGRSREDKAKHNKIESQRIMKMVG